MGRALIIGCGGVASVVIHKCCQNSEVFEEIMNGRMTFQRAFMTGEMTAKGNFKTLRMLDQIFLF